MLTLSHVGTKWIATLPSELKQIKWSVGDDYKILYVRGDMVTFEPVEQIKGFKEEIMISSEIFLKHFQQKK